MIMLLENSLDKEFYTYFKPLHDNVEFDDFNQAFEAAKDNDEDAIFYLIDLAKQNIYARYWTNFIGKAASKQVLKNKINSGAFGDFCGIVYEAFEKALDTFDPTKYSYGNAASKWAYWFAGDKSYLQAACVKANKDEMGDPLFGAYNPESDFDNDDSNQNAFDRALGSEIAYTTDYAEDDFFDAWNELLNDPAIEKTMKIGKEKMPLRVIIATILDKGYNEKMSIPDLAEELDTTRNTLYSASKQFAQISKEHKVDTDTVEKIFIKDPDFIINGLRD